LSKDCIQWVATLMRFAGTVLNSASKKQVEMIVEALRLLALNKPGVAIEAYIASG